MAKKELNLNEKIERLKEIANKLTDSSLDLKEAMELYKEGIELVKECNKEIDEAENTILKLTPDNEEVPVTEDLDAVILEDIDGEELQE